MRLFGSKKNKSWSSVGLMQHQGNKFLRSARRENRLSNRIAIKKVFLSSK